MQVLNLGFDPCVEECSESHASAESVQCRSGYLVSCNCEAAGEVAHTGIAEEFGHGQSVIWTYLPPGPSNPALHLLLNALGTLLLDKQTLDTLVTASNLITSVIL